MNSNNQPTKLNSLINRTDPDNIDKAKTKYLIHQQKKTDDTDQIIHKYRERDKSEISEPRTKNTNQTTAKRRTIFVHDTKATNYISQ